MSTTCTVTGRIHRTAAEKHAELTRIDSQLTAVRGALTQLDAMNLEFVPEPVTDAWNALHDAERELHAERADVEANPRPIPAGEAGTYELVRQNRD